MSAPTPFHFSPCQWQTKRAGDQRGGVHQKDFAVLPASPLRPVATGSPVRSASDSPGPGSGLGSDRNPHGRRCEATLPTSQVGAAHKVPQGEYSPLTKTANPLQPIQPEANAAAPDLSLSSVNDIVRKTSEYEQLLEKEVFHAELADLVTQSERTAEEFASHSTEMMNLNAKVMFEQAQLLGTILKYRIAEAKFNFDTLGCLDGKTMTMIVPAASILQSEKV